MKMPIAYLDVAARYVELAPHTIFKTPTVADLGSPVGLYLEQPWVGLTEEEFAEVLCDDRWQGRPELMLLQVQSKLKEKNT